MKILHFGGLPFLRQGLAQAEQALGLTTFSEPVTEVGSLALASQANLVTNPGITELAAIDIVHMHQLPNAEQLQGLLQEKKLHGTKLVLQDYGYVNLSSADLEIFDHIFLSSVENYATVSAQGSYSWLPATCALGTASKAGRNEPGHKELSVLHIPYALNPKFTDQIILAIEQLQSKLPRFKFELLKPEDVDDDVKLLAAFERADLFIERIGTQSYGPLALLALGLGCPVLSTNSQQARDIWQHLSLSPVVTCDEKNLERRLSSILREPRSLRDFSTRSLRFFEERHKAEASAKLAFDVYKKLVSVHGK